MTATQLSGRAASPGVALAPAFVIQPPEPVDTDREAASPEEETERLDAALAEVEEQLTELAESQRETLGDEADIFLAHADFAGDPEIAEMAHDHIDDGATAERAVTEAFDSFRALLEQSSDEYLAGRAADIDDVRDQVLDVLAGRDAAPVPTEESVVVAEELTPSQTAKLPRELIAAIATEKGSPTSHAAILSRSLGIPAVVGCAGVLEASAGVLVGVDGREGRVDVDPDDRRRDELRDAIEREREHRRRLAELRDQPGRTADGRHIELAANLGGPDAVPSAVEHGAEGSGLVRTEFLFQEAQEEPGVDEQAAFYREALAAFPGHRVVFRTMDIGADKPLPFVDREPEENPALGVRGLRLGLVQPDLLTNQLRALLRAHRDAGDERGRTAIMFPLVSTGDEVRRAREALDQAAAAEGVDLADVEVGIMVEVPAAALAARRIAPLVDFFSIGTNDLLQYLFAADRLLADVADLPDVLDPGVLTLVGQVVEAADDVGGWVGVCGEAAADLYAAAAFVGLGVRELSMSPTAIGEVKAMLADVAYETLRSAAKQATQAQDADEVRTILRDIVA